MIKDKFAAIENDPIIASLTAEERAHLNKTAQNISLKKDQTLFNRGDLSDSLYFVLEGKLSGFLLISQQVKQIANLQPGDVIGELGLWDENNRSLNICALEKCKLLKIGYDAIKPILINNPTCQQAITSLIISRFHRVIDMWSTQAYCSHVLLITLDQHPVHKSFSEILKSLLSTYQNCHYWPVAFPEENTALTASHAPEWLAKNTVEGALNVYHLPSHQLHLLKTLIGLVNHIYIVTSHHYHLSNQNLALLHLLQSLKLQETHFSLVMLHTDPIPYITNAHLWFKQFPFFYVHHLLVTERDHKDCSRLARHITGNSVAVVLSGGATRGWAHIGALKAMHDLNIPIDFIAGSSVGLLMAAVYATTRSPDETLALVSKMIEGSKKLFSWKKLTFPINALFNHKPQTHSLKQLLNNKKIEDLAIPLFAISTNLSMHCLDERTHGDLWPPVRAGMAIPGLFGPVMLDGAICMDAALLNNLPTDLMRKRLLPGSKIIAVDISNIEPNTTKYDLPCDLSLAESLMIFLNLKGKNYRYPKIFEVLLRSVMIGSEAKTIANRQLADILIIPNVSRFAFTNLGELNQLYDIGYQSAFEVLLPYDKLQINSDS